MKQQPMILTMTWAAMSAQAITVTDTIFNRAKHETFAFGADVSFMPMMEMGHKVARHGWAAERHPSDSEGARHQQHPSARVEGEQWLQSYYKAGSTWL